MLVNSNGLRIYKYQSDSNQYIKRIFQSIGKMCILDIDVQGVRALKAHMDNNGSGHSGPSPLDPVFAFVRPPSLEVLEKRLRDRGTETEEAIQKVTKMLNGIAFHYFYILARK